MTRLSYRYSKAQFDYDSGGWSSKEWVEYKGEIPRLEEFTSCHWDKIRHFSPDIMTVWSYCTAERKNTAKIKCTQLFYSGNQTTTNQQVILSGFLNEGDGYFSGNIEAYRHRSWNHICWSYSSKTGINKLYYNGQVVGTVSINGAPPIDGSDNSTIASFILGQEPAVFNGGYDAAQLFNGEVSELNFWDTVLDDEDIVNMAQCKHWGNGTVLSWEKSSIINHGALIKDQNDAELFCKQEKKFVIFPQRQTLQVAKDLCASHGGEIIVPLSAEENNDMMSILNKHTDICQEENPTNVANTDKGTWLGLSKKDSIWYKVNNEGLLQTLNFSNWDTKPQRLAKPDCTYTLRDGRWSFANPETCVELSLCTICSIIGIPVFTVNGFCKANVYDFNYYLVTDEKNAVHHYEGYKIANIILEKNRWAFVTKKKSATISSIELEVFKEYIFPVGRSQWEMYDPMCGIHKAQNNSLSLSTCKFGLQFTCNSGSCVDLENRCNQTIDCSDGSDEQGCKLVQVPATYRKVAPPKPLNHSTPLAITTFIEIVSIDTINTIDMKVGLTLNIIMRWLDSRLKFANLTPGDKNRVQQRTVGDLWIPLDYVIHKNAVIGEIFQDMEIDVGVESEAPPMPMDHEHAIQNTLYSGTDTTMEVTQSYRIMYTCTFNLRNFPFDSQNCTFVMMMKTGRHTNVSFEKDEPAVAYNGPKMVEAFEIGQIMAYTEYTGTVAKSLTTFKFTIAMDRISTDMLITAFFPTCLLWLLPYFTLFIKIDDFNERIMVSVTVLLVMGSLVSTIEGDLPDTSYFMYIDVWFLWYTGNIFSITAFHILLKETDDNRTGRLHAKEKFGTKDANKTQNTTGKSKKARLNGMAKKIFLFAFLIFNAIYFPVQM